MKRIIKRLPKRLAAGVMSLVMILGLSSTVLAAFGPDRETKVWTPQENGFQHVTFNSYTGVPEGIGDERDFFRGVQVGRDGNWIDPVTNVEQDAEIEAKIYIHNDADPLLNDAPGNPGIARNTNVRVALPTGEKQTQEAKSFIKADNATPREIFDTLTMTGANNGFFALERVANSAKIHDVSGAATDLTDAQENALFSEGGFTIGDVRGCFEFRKEITFRVKVKMPHYTVKKQVRFEGQTKADWKESVNAKAGQTLEWKIEFDNIGRTQLDNVVILDQLPEGLTVVPGSVRQVDGNFPLSTGGYQHPDADAIQNNGRQINVNIGKVNPGINSVILFKTTVNDVCGTHKRLNTGYATPEGYSPVNDEAEVVVEGKVCEKPEEKPEQPQKPQKPQPTTLPNTGAGDVIGMFTAVTVAGAAAHRFVYSRRSL